MAKDTAARKRDLDEIIRDAARAHTSLTLLAKIQELAEGSDIDASSQPALFKIVRILAQEQQKQLRRYDRFVLEAGR